MEVNWIEVLSAVSTAAAAIIALFFGTIPIVQRRREEYSLANLRAARIHPQIINLLNETSAIIPILHSYKSLKAEEMDWLYNSVAKLNILCVNIDSSSLDAIVSLSSNCANKLASAFGLLQVAAAEAAIAHQNPDWGAVSGRSRLKNIESWQALVFRAAGLLEEAEKVIAQRLALTRIDHA